MAEMPLWHPETRASQVPSFQLPQLPAWQPSSRGETLAMPYALLGDGELRVVQDGMVPGLVSCCKISWPIRGPNVERYPDPTGGVRMV